MNFTSNTLLLSFITLAINLQMLKARSTSHTSNFKTVIPRIETVLKEKREAALVKMAETRKIQKPHRNRRSINLDTIAPTPVPVRERSTKKVLKFKKCNSSLIGKVLGTTYCMHQVSTMIKVSI